MIWCRNDDRTNPTKDFGTIGDKFCSRWGMQQVLFLMLYTTAYRSQDATAFWHSMNDFIHAEQFRTIRWTVWNLTAEAVSKGFWMHRSVPKSGWSLRRKTAMSAMLTTSGLTPTCHRPLCSSPIELPLRGVRWGQQRSNRMVMAFVACATLAPTHVFMRAPNAPLAPRCQQTALLSHAILVIWRQLFYSVSRVRQMRHWGNETQNGPIFGSLTKPA